MARLADRRGGGPAERAESLAAGPPAAVPDLVALMRRPAPGRHLDSVVVAGATVSTLADLPPLRDRLLFVGLNPSPVSVASGHYHQGRLGRLFWRRLMAAGILPADTALESADDALVAAGHGITDLIKAPTPRDVATRAELTAGVVPLWQKVAIWRPAAVVFIYKRAAEIAAGRALPERWGPLAGVALAARPCLLMPGPYRPATEVAEALTFFRNLSGILPGAFPAGWPPCPGRRLTGQARPSARSASRATGSTTGRRHVEPRHR